MNFIEERIREEGCVKSGGVLKVDAFLNHQIDMALVDEIAAEFVRRFADTPVNKVLTIETSGIILAGAVARLLKVPMVIARKTRSMNLDGDSYVAEFLSFNHKNIKTVVVSRKYLNKEDRVLVIDDIMANGCAMQGLISIVEDAEAEVVGCGVVIEKSFQEGADRIRNLGYRLESLVAVESMDEATGAITFR
ncbi:MAG: xanthine phosphoribosyltransferase [Oscillospiraceae bacterium]|nr:xanthine phosphoribosyltransferase [Oscillospiraceae bacterium]